MINELLDGNTFDGCSLSAYIIFRIPLMFERTHTHKWLTIYGVYLTTNIGAKHSKSRILHCVSFNVE